VWSVFVKKGTTRYVALSHFSDSTQWAVFDLDNGVIQDEAGSDVPAKIENYGNGWYRISKGATITTGQSTNYVKLTIATPSSPSVGVSGETVDIWGFQIEIGLYLSSFIPTTTVGSITTRSADAANGAEATFNDSEGVLYANIAALADDLENKYIGICNGTDDERVLIGFRNSSNSVRTIITGGSASAGIVNFDISDITIFNKIAVRYNSSEMNLWINGTEVGTDSSLILPTGLSQINFNSGQGSSNFYGKTKELMTFNEALSDSELEDLTSWDSFNEMATEQLYTIE
jgi:hypothetical protein